MKIEKIGIFAKPHQPKTKNVVRELMEYLLKTNVEIFPDKSLKPLLEKNCRTYDSLEIGSKVDAIVVLGGDGTILHVARILNDFDIPILAINLGGLGFLTEIPLPELYTALDRAFQGDFVIIERDMLHAKLIRGDNEVGNQRVLNDVVINKAALARMIDLDITVNNQKVTHYKADGLIICTPTGSTAYNLAAGGPILSPRMKAFVITPICPHMLTNRPIVIPDDSVIRVKLTTKKEEVTLTLDGQIGYKMQVDDVVEVRKAVKTLKMLQLPEHNFFDVLRLKLKWGER